MEAVCSSDMLVYTYRFRTQCRKPQNHNVVACRLKAWLYESTRKSIAKQRLQLKLFSVSAEMNTLAVVASENRKLKGSTGCSLSSRQRINLRECPTEPTDRLPRNVYWRQKTFMCAVVTVIFWVYNSVSVIIIVLKSVTRKRLLKTEDFYVSCGYSDIWSVWFSGTVIVGCDGDP
jgi:hypothetical protein